MTTPYDGTIWNNPTPPPALTGVSHSTFPSASMGVDVGYTIYLPSEYLTLPTKRFPVIYFLHGRMGNERDWSSFGMVPPTQQVILVFPNGGQDSKYCDAVSGSPMFGVEMSETAIIAELIPHIDATYRTIANKGGRAIQGFSMGGQGCLRLAFKYPALFSSVFSFAAAIQYSGAGMFSTEPTFMAQMMNNSQSLWDAQATDSLATNNVANIASHIFIHMAVVSSDGLLGSNQSFDSLLTSLSIPHDALDVFTSPDGHSKESNVDSVDWAMSHFTLTEPQPGSPGLVALLGLQ